MRLNRRFLEQAVKFIPQLVWVEMGRSIYANTLMRIKERFGCLLVNSYSDDFMHSRSRHYNRAISLYDHIFTPREINFSEYYRLGAKAVSKFWKGFDPETHFPTELTPDERKIYGADVAFIGRCEPDRIERLSALAATIEDLKIWGPRWDRYKLPKVLRRKVQYRSVWKTEYRKAICGAKIVVNYLSKWARDTQASKSFEIPACKAFMLTERTEDLLSAFEEDKEAVFFTTTEELIEKVKFYLRHDKLREKIADAGYRRCLESGYSNYDRIRTMVEKVLAQAELPY